MASDYSVTRGVLESVETGQLAGWLESSSHAPVTLDVYIDEHFVCHGTTLANAERSEVNLYRHAFRIPLPSAFQDNRQHVIDVCIAGTLVSLEQAPMLVKLVGRKQDAPDPKAYPFRQGTVEGKLDRVSEQEIAGWVWDKAQADTPLTLEILDGDTVIDLVTADRYRADLETAAKGNGHHAFRVPWPMALSDGEPHAISARIQGTDHVLHPGPRRFTHKAVRPYQTFEEYMRWAMLHRYIYYPLQENDYRVLGFMEGYRKRLADKYLAEDDNYTVAIIMPAYNRESIIGDAIDSILAQQFARWELHIIDDCSTDDTLKVARRYARRDKRIHVHALKKNQGHSVARNTGLAAAKADYIAYLDTDNTWEPDYLLLMAGMLHDTPEAESIYCGQHIMETHHSRLHGVQVKEAIRFGPFHRALLENRNTIDLNVFMHRHSVWKQKGGFREDMRRFTDWELILRYTEEVAPVALPCVLSQYQSGITDNQVSQVEKVGPADAMIDETLRRHPFALPESTQDTPEYTFFHTMGTTRPVKTVRPVSIIIASFEAPEYLRYCVESVHACTPKGSYEIIIVDNASSSETQNVLDTLSEHVAVRVIRNETNTGFTWATNQGIAAAAPEHDIVLLNNDALVTEGWLEALQEVVEADPEAGIIVPRQTLLPGTPTTDVHVPSSLRQRELDVTLSAHHGNILQPDYAPLKGWVELNFAPFFCAYITRSCLEKVGPLDAINGRHYRSDRLYCDAVRQIGQMRIVYTPHAKLYHFLQQATKALKKKHHADYQKIFVENRWDDGEVDALSVPKSHTPRLSKIKA